MKILVITLTNVGDVVMTTPVMTSLRRRYPKAQMTLMVGPRAAGIFENDSTLNQVVVYDKKSSLKAKWDLARRLRAEQFDLVIDLRSTLYPLLLGHWKGYLGALTYGRRGPHRIDQHLGRLAIHGIEPFGEFYIPESESVARRVDKLFSKKGIKKGEVVVAFNPGARSQIKRWTSKGFGEVAETLAARGYRVLWIGDGSDGEIVDGLMAQIVPGWVSVCGETSLADLAEVLRRCRLLVTNDSAPMHLARAVGTATVSIFGPTDEAKYAPRGNRHRVVRTRPACAPCEAAQCRYNHECMKDLKPAEVIRAALELLAP